MGKILCTSLRVLLFCYGCAAAAYIFLQCLQHVDIHSHFLLSVLSILQSRIVNDNVFDPYFT